MVEILVTLLEGEEGLGRQIGRAFMYFTQGIWAQMTFFFFWKQKECIGRDTRYEV